jgi:tRNA wybutosine-synthesizing protein 1
LDANLAELGADRLFPVALGDDQRNLEQAFYKWSSAAVKLVHEESFPKDKSTTNKKSKKQNIQQQQPSSNKTKSSSSSCCNSSSAGTGTNSGSNHDHSDSCCKSNSGDEVELEAEDLINNAYVDMEFEEGVLDMEDLGHHITNSSNANSASDNPDNRREMVTKLQRQALTKEGYKIIGTHSAVKLCRWTKNQLRGRGGCYKHSFYGITSYQCMEATPSLACANKCVFCWRHHKNPVGTEWRWKEDSPDMIVQQAISLHVNMVHEMKGVPGVIPERYEEAHTVRHCALSLVGEPIMYPRINEMLFELHRRDISSFLVTNAQFPDRIDQLDPVTQLYVSIDAATKDSLKAIDRPLFKDFWERYLASLAAIKKKAQRTVYRMTLVKSWNMEELDGYAQLIEYGMPDFIEIKAVTYCGKSDASSLTMQNVPWHEEVCTYASHLCERLRERGYCQGTNYSIATEHQHSCCILIAREDKFKVNGVWHTWIDYDKFHALMRAYYDSNKTSTFRSEDYMAITPEWAVYQSKERGFDPVEVRWKRGDKGNQQMDPSLIPDPNESGCG